MITNNFKVEDGNLIIPKEELINLRNKYRNYAFTYAKERNFTISEVFQELINLTEPRKE